MTTRDEDREEAAGAHYKKCGVEPFAVMFNIFTDDEIKGFIKGNIIKYSIRNGIKDETNEKDVEKARFYMEMLSNFDLYKQFYIRDYSGENTCGS